VTTEYNGAILHEGKGNGLGSEHGADRVTILSNSTAWIAHTAKLDFSSNHRSRKPDAGRVLFNLPGCTRQYVFL